MAIAATLCFIFVYFYFVSAEFNGSATKLYLSMLSGYFSNEANLDNLCEQGIKTNQDLLKVFNHPINKIPDLIYDFDLYSEEWTGNELIRQEILTLSGEGDIVVAQPYLFKKPESFVPGTFNISDLQFLTLKDVVLRKECRFMIERIDETMFMYTVPDCSQTTLSQVYVAQTSCNSVTFSSVDDTHPEAKSKLPYNLKKIESYPIPDSIMPDYDTYKSLCQY